MSPRPRAHTLTLARHAHCHYDAHASTHSLTRLFLRDDFRTVVALRVWRRAVSVAVGAHALSGVVIEPSGLEMLVRATRSSPCHVAVCGMLCSHYFTV